MLLHCGEMMNLSLGIVVHTLISQEARDANIYILKCKGSNYHEGKTYRNHMDPIFHHKIDMCLEWVRTLIDFNYVDSEGSHNEG